MRDAAGRQCKLLRIDVMCSYLRVLVRMRAAIFCMDCRRLMEQEGSHWNSPVNCSSPIETKQNACVNCTAAFSGRKLRMFEIFFRWKSDLADIFNHKTSSIPRNTLLSKYILDYRAHAFGGPTVGQCVGFTGN